MDEIATIVRPVRQPLVVYRGNSLRVVFRLRLGCGGSYVTLTGFDGDARVRASIDHPTEGVPLLVAVDQTSGGSTKGTVVVSATPEQTMMFPEVGVWDLVLFNADNTVRKTILQGPLVFERNVT